MRRVIQIGLVSLALSAAANAQPVLDGRLADLTFGASLETSRASLATRCGSLRSVAVEPASFPLAREREVHLACDRFADGETTIRQLALTFADDQLVMLYASGNAAASLQALAKRPLQSYLHFTVSFEERLVIDAAIDRAWLLAQEALHPNLFLWPNPYLATAAVANYEASAAVPEILRFGGQLDELEPLFEARCDFMHLDTYRVWLLTQPDLQQQIDCFGYEFAGFPRKIEAVFGDGVLEQAWILTAESEEARVRGALIVEFGEPIYVDSTWEIFDDNRVMLRKDKPEVLMLSDRLAPLFRRREIDNE